MKNIQKTIWLILACLFIFASCDNDPKDESNCEFWQMPINSKEQGRPTAIAISPQSDDIRIVAAESGGLFRTLDGGMNWEHLDDFTTLRPIDVKYSPTDPNIVLAAALQDFATTNGGGIWRSTDGGTTWAHVPEASPPPSTRCRDRISAWSLSFVPGSDTVYAGHDCGLVMSPDNGETWKHSNPVSGNTINTDRIQDRVRCVLASGNGIVRVVGHDSIGFSLDGGQTWTRSQPTHIGTRGNFLLATSPFNPRHLFFLPYGKHTYLTVDEGQSWIHDQSGNSGLRPPFIVTAISTSGNSDEFDIYRGQGKRFYKKTHKDGSTPTAVGDWAEITIPHWDPSHLAIASDGMTPLMLATDGGLHRTTDQGASWKHTGKMWKGFDALQICEIKGQLFWNNKTKKYEHHLYFGTQDNAFWASRDGGTTWPGKIWSEGGFIYLTPEIFYESDARPVFRNFPSNENRISDMLYENKEVWANPPDYSSNSYPVRLNKYQHFQMDLDTITGDILLLTTNNEGLPIDGNSSWIQKGVMNWQWSHTPLVSGPWDNPVIYTPIVTGTNTWSLARINNILGTDPPTVTQITGINTLGCLPTMFAWYMVYGLNPIDPDNLIVPDVGDGVIRITKDGGNTWTTDTDLFDLVTDNGNLLFSDPLHWHGRQMGQITCIEFNRNNPDHIAVGTAQAGVMCSYNGGESWEKIPDSEKVGNISRIYFHVENRLICSSYGRGLWVFNCPKEAKVYDPAFNPNDTITPEKPELEYEAPSIYTFLKDKYWHKEILTRRNLKVKCPPICEYITFDAGELKGIVLESGKLKEVKLDKGGISTWRGPNEESQNRFQFSVESSKSDFSNHPILQRLHKSKKSIRGLMINEKGEIAGALTDNQPINFKDLNARTILGPSVTKPYISMFCLDGPLDDVITESSGRIRIIGRNFLAGRENPAKILINGIAIRTIIYPDAEGNFSIQIKTPNIDPGIHSVEIIQGKGEKQTKLKRNFRLVPKDDFEKQM